MFTSDPELAKVLRQIAHHGQERRYYHVRVGVNSRLDTIQAAILLPKLTILDYEIAARRSLASAYNNAFRDYAIRTPQNHHDRGSAWAQYTIRVAERDRVQERLKEAGIPTAVHYPLALNRQPAVADPDANVPHGDKAAKEVLSLPMHAYMTHHDRQHVIEKVIDLASTQVYT